MRDRTRKEGRKKETKISLVAENNMRRQSSNSENGGRRILYNSRLKEKRWSWKGEGDNFYSLQDFYGSEDQRTATIFLGFHKHLWEVTGAVADNRRKQSSIKMWSN